MTNRYLDKKSQLPVSYVEHIEGLNGWEGDLGGGDGYVVIWNKETIQSRWADYHMAEFISDYWFPFGSDGGGEMLCFDLRRRDDVVFLMPYVGMSDAEAMRRYDSFKTLSVKIQALA
jgi:hypothetical protein